MKQPHLFWEVRKGFEALVLGRLVGKKGLKRKGLLEESAFSCVCAPVWGVEETPPTLFGTGG